jgi:hypothetical protein
MCVVTHTGLLRRLLCQGDVDSLRSAQYVAKGIGVTQAREQASTPASIPDRVGSSSHRYPGVAQGLQVPQPPPLTSEQLRQQTKAVYAEADQVYSKWSQLCEDVRSKRRELDAVLASRQGVQQPAVSSSITSYEDLLLQVRFGPYTVAPFVCWHWKWSHTAKPILYPFESVTVLLSSIGTSSRRSIRRGRHFAVLGVQAARTVGLSGWASPAAHVPPCSQLMATCIVMAPSGCSAVVLDGRWFESQTCQVAAQGPAGAVPALTY